MVKINNEYIINANESCYKLEKIGQVEDVESQNYGKETKTIQGYYTTIENALNGYIKVKLRKYISSETENTMKELIKQIEKLEIYVKQITKEM